MSFNTHDKAPVISRDNYEEYLLLYVDGELNEAETKAVEAFLLANPDLQAELDVLMSTKLEPEAFSFDGKEALLSANMGNAVIDEDLLLYVDDELAGVQKEAVEKKLQADEVYRLQHALLLRTKSDPAEVVLHPAKEELYRHTVHRIGLRPLLRIAAVVLVMLSLGVVYLQQEGNDKPLANTNTPSANTSAGQKAVDTNKDAVETATGVASKEVEQSELIKQSQLASNNTIRKQHLPQAKNTATKLSNTPATKQEVEEETLLAHKEPTLPSHTEEAVATKTMAQNNLPQTVTTEPAQPYQQQTTAAVEPQFAAATEDNRSGGGIKGFLRKATRMVERRTGINATTDDEELVIGAVAIKLK